ncbi:hypothetical protein A2U01_0118467, partial [Trifolium medium]|nr:hypothetical protein [Trifolium medium]
MSSHGKKTLSIIGDEASSARQR